MIETELFKKAKELGISDIGIETIGIGKYSTDWRKIIIIRNAKMTLNYYKNNGIGEAIALYKGSNNRFIYYPNDRFNNRKHLQISIL